MINQFSQLEMKAAEMAAMEGKTHVVAWGRSNKYGYEVDVFKLPQLECIHSGFTNRKAFRQLDKTTGINVRELRRRAKVLSDMIFKK
jgi:hypothetical protein